MNIFSHEIFRGAGIMKLYLSQDPKKTKKSEYSSSASFQPFGRALSISRTEQDGEIASANLELREL